MKTMKNLRNIRVFSTVILIIMLALIPLANAKVTPKGQIFYNSLDSKKTVEDGGGTVHGGSFETGRHGNGFLADAAGESVSFPTAGNMKLDVGSIALWVKVMADIKDVPGESFVFMMYKRGNDAFFINHSHGWNPLGVCFMIKNKGKWFTQGKGKSCSQDLDWKKGETHHIVTTWGPKGHQLWLDGKLVGQAPGHKTGPSLMDDDFWVGNIEIEKKSTLPSKWIQDELYIFDTQIEQAEIDRLMKPSTTAVDPSHNKLSLTWSTIKLK